MTIRSTINNGLPVDASGEFHPPEPDVGLPRRYVDNIVITFLSGHEFPGELSDEDDQRIVQELLEAYDELHRITTNG